MNSVYFYINNIFYCDFINKFNFNTPSNRFFKIQKLVLSTKLTTVNIKELISKLLALEIITFKKSFFDPHFYITIKKGEYFVIKVEIRKKNIELLILNYLWHIASKKIKQKNVLINQKSNKKINLSFKFNLIKKIEYFFDFKNNTNTLLHVNFIFDAYDKKKINFFFKSLKLYF
nr:ribosomal protein L5 [Actinocyclus sp. mgcode 4]